MNTGQYSEALDGLTDEEVAEHFAALLALALAIEEGENEPTAQEWAD